MSALTVDIISSKCDGLTGQCGYNMTPIKDVLLATRTKYHDLLSSSIADSAAKLVLDDDMQHVSPPITRSKHKSIVGSAHALFEKFTQKAIGSSVAAVPAIFSSTQAPTSTTYTAIFLAPLSHLQQQFASWRLSSAAQ